MSLSELNPDLQPFADDLIQATAQARLNPRVTSTRRTHQEQKRLYEKFLRGESRFPVAPPGQSAHEYGWAFDMVTYPMSALIDEVGPYWKAMGGVWGPSDPIHFEYPGFSPPAPDPSVVEIVQQTAEWYANLPWWATILLPSATSASPGRIEDVSKGSPGARLLCSLGVHNFC